MQDRCKDLPGHIELIIPDKVTVIAFERVEYERLVSLGNPGILESPLISQVEFSGDSTGSESGEFRVHLEPYSFVGLNTHDKLVSGDTGEYA